MPHAWYLHLIRANPSTSPSIHLPVHSSNRELKWKGRQKAESWERLVPQIEQKLKWPYDSFCQSFLEKYKIPTGNADTFVLSSVRILKCLIQAKQCRRRNTDAGKFNQFCWFYRLFAAIVKILLATIIFEGNLWLLPTSLMFIGFYTS